MTSPYECCTTAWTLTVTCRVLLPSANVSVTLDAAWVQGYLVGVSAWSIPAGTIAVITTIKYLRPESRRLAHIPTVGGASDPVLSYLSAVHHMRNGQAITKEGYEKHIGGTFKIAGLDRWRVLVTGPKLLQELHQLPDDVMSFDVATEKDEYTLGKPVFKDPWHVEVLKHKLTKNLAPMFPDIYDEIEHAFGDAISLGDDWTPVHAVPMVMKVVARASNRAFLSLPMCRNGELLELAIRFTIDVAISGKIVSLFPGFLKPLVASYLTPLGKTVQKATRILFPEASVDLSLRNSDDMLMWLMESGQGHPTRSSNYDLVMRILALNFAAIHTSSNTFTHALYTLATHPEVVGLIREENETIIAAEGISKPAITRMVKLDSFLRSTTRLDAFTGATLLRLVLKDHTFCDGTFVPAGTMVFAPVYAHYTDADNYADPLAFDAWRFVPRKDEEGPRKAFTSTDLQFLPFGHGRHACPGRFFAGNELKAMLCNVILKYDVRMEADGVRPEDFPVGTTMLPNQKAKVLFRKRRA